MGSPSCPVHGGMSKQSNGLGNSTTQNSFAQTPTPWTNKQSGNQTPQFDNTRDAVAYAWDKQHPNGGMTKMTGPLGDISYYDENLYKPNEEEEKQTTNQMLGLAKNSSTQPVGFASQTFGKKPSDEEKFNAQNELQDFLKDKEKLVEHPYLDTRGLVTSGYGTMDENAQRFSRHPFFNKYTREPYSEQEKIAEFGRMKGLEYGQTFTANRYKKQTDFRITPEYANQLLGQEVEVRKQELSNKFPNFNRMSPSMQNALLETHYNANVLAKKDNGDDAWPNLKKAAEVMNQDDFCKNLHRDSTNRPDLKDRNDWAYRQCKHGYFY